MDQASKLAIKDSTQSAKTSLFGFFSISTSISMLVMNSN
jgi:hypothetical protein